MQRPWPQGPKPESCALIIRPPRTKINLVYFLVEVHQQRSLWPPRIRWGPQQSMSGANQLRPVQRKRRTWRAASHAQDQVWKPWRSRGRKGRGVWGDAVEMAGVSEWHWCLFPKFGHDREVFRFSVSRWRRIGRSPRDTSGQSLSPVPGAGIVSAAKLVLPLGCFAF